MPRSVVITGTSSGIGRASALALQARGFTVFAGVRDPADGEALRTASGGDIVPVRIDVTDGESIATAVAQVQEATGAAGLSGLVNNAGNGAPWPMELVPLEVFRDHLEVNLTGQLAVTQAFLPLIKRARGRIVNVGSEGGRITLPFLGPITVAKHGLVSVTDALRMELRPWGVQVSIVEPGATQSRAPVKLVENGRRAVAELFPARGRADYGATFMHVIEKIASGHERTGSPPEVIARAVVKAMTAPRPRTRYPVGGHAKLLTRLQRVLPDRAMDALFLRMLGLDRASSSASSTTAGV
ncbi:SDR family NAD(P)-dependent oxidoreductase [Nonomuraea angiospora]|uniref:NAD(P)-dependent dehydrogenase (Short-subunit alcohol dehydrogenase family) n=1 Tax=Nonomuraea angiospora TaxID=46172 RepID=A0ABR9LSY2_9ACTN|nr:SDR family NAD(P)-dependent oxidoreductase [Nonomuraea angiospora]MBE1583775.1 NAD(P)-dependent dehydrogenase (short-subunit alcohol dehydrogenase family) [Nonomuraea angiospora]